MSNPKKVLARGFSQEALVTLAENFNSLKAKAGLFTTLGVTAKAKADGVVNITNKAYMVLQDVIAFTGPIRSSASYQTDKHKIVDSLELLSHHSKGEAVTNYERALRDVVTAFNLKAKMYGFPCRLQK